MRIALVCTRADGAHVASPRMPMSDDPHRMAREPGTDRDGRAEAVAAAGRMVRAAGVITLAIGLGRLLGLVREILLANLVGAGPLSDSFVLAVAITDFVSSMLIAGSVSAVIPTLARARDAGGEAASDARAKELLLLGAIVAATSCAAIVLAADPIVTLMTPPEAVVVRQTAPTLLRITSLVALLFVAGSIPTELYVMRSRFFLSSIGTVFFNITAISGFLVYGIVRETWLLAASLAAAAVVRALVLAPPVRSALRRTAAIGIRSVRRTAVEFGAIATPAVVTAAVFYVNALVSQAAALRVTAGGAASLYYSVRLVEAPLAIASALAIAIFPALVRSITARELDDSRELHRLGQQVALGGTLPVALLFLIAPAAFVTALFERGAFDERAAALTASTLRTLALGIPFTAAAAVTVRVFQAHRDTRTPLLAAAVAVATNASLQALLAPALGMSGVGLASALAALANAAAIAVLARRRRYIALLGRRDGVDLFDTLLASVLATGSFVIASAVLTSAGAPPKVVVGTAAVLAAAAYLATHRARGSVVWRLSLGRLGGSLRGPRT